MIAIVGAIICFIGDNLLGFFMRAADFGNKYRDIYLAGGLWLHFATATV